MESKESYPTLTLAELRQMSPKFRREYFDSEPVYYCEDCHSLDIRMADSFSAVWDGSYCHTCGSTNISVSTIEDWLSLTGNDTGDTRR